MEDQYSQMLKKRQEILERMANKKRMMEFLERPKYTEPPEQLVKRHEMAKKIQRKWKAVLARRRAKVHINKDYHIIIRIQRCVRRYLAAKAKEKFKKLYSFTNVAKLLTKIDPSNVKQRKEQIQKYIKITPKPSPEALKEAEDTFLSKVKEYNIAFPTLISNRIDNETNYEMSRKLMEHVQNNKNLQEHAYFSDFKLDNNKKLRTKVKVEKILEQMRLNLRSQAQFGFDDFETSNLINEIDAHFHWKKVKLDL